MQEIVPLNVSNAFSKDKQRVFHWEKIFELSLRKYDNYLCFGRKVMVGCLILVFVKDIHKNRISYMRKCKIKTGYGGNTGNKGGVGIRFNFDNSTLTFMNCHLSSG